MILLCEYTSLCVVALVGAVYLSYHVSLRIFCLTEGLVQQGQARQVCQALDGGVHIHTTCPGGVLCTPVHDQTIVEGAVTAALVTDTDRKGGERFQCGDVEVWLRVTRNVEYIKVVVERGKVIGALLVGDTDLEEVFENLIMNELDVSSYGIELLNPDIDLEGYFD